ncbi:peptidase inhibitor family I36 protein [Streptomyces sp. NPDC001407]|uniref:peptidase inhibitor family I36 protein n=1 Tax=Streptomyces sp. NPDC001407 TaxID=3364573 RepID=UPI0036C29765
MRTIRFAALAVGAAAGLALVSAPAATASAPARPGACGAGQLCLWPKADYRGVRTTSELSGIDIASCVTLPAGPGAASFVNRTGRPVTTYQSATCAETGEFATYPSGTWVPESPYAVRAYKVWEN